MSLAADGDVQALSILQDTTNAATATHELANGDATSGLLSKVPVAQESNLADTHDGTAESDELAQEVAREESAEADAAATKENGAALEEDVAIEVAESKADSDAAADTHKVLGDEAVGSPDEDVTDASALHGTADELDGHAPTDDTVVEEEAVAVVATDAHEELELVTAPSAAEGAEVPETAEPAEATVIPEESAASDEIAITVEEPDVVAEELEFTPVAEDVPSAADESIVAEAEPAQAVVIALSEEAPVETDVEVAIEELGAVPAPPALEAEAVSEAVPAPIEVVEEVAQDLSVEDPVRIVEDVPTAEEAAPPAIVEEESVAVIEPVEPEPESVTAGEPVAFEVEEQTEAPDVVLTEVEAPTAEVEIEVPVTEKVEEVEPEATVAVEEAAEPTLEAPAEPDVVPVEAVENTEQVTVVEEELVSEEPAAEGIAAISEDVLEEASPSAHAMESRVDGVADVPAPEPVEETVVAEEVLAGEATSVEESAPLVPEEASEDVSVPEVAEAIVEETTIAAPAAEDEVPVSAVAAPEEALVVEEEVTEASIEGSTEAAAEAPTEVLPEAVEEASAAAETVSDEVEDLANEDVKEPQESPDAAIEVIAADSPEEVPAVETTETSEPEEAVLVVVDAHPEDVSAAEESLETIQVEEAVEASPEPEAVAVLSEHPDTAPEISVSVVEEDHETSAESEDVPVEALAEPEVAETPISVEVTDSAGLEGTSAVAAKVDELTETPVITVNTDNGASERLLTTQEAEERPKSPWTPSYSVTTQGPGAVGPAVDEDEIAELEPLPPSAASDEPNVPEPVIEVSVVQTDVTEVEGEEAVEAELEAKAPSAVVVTETAAEERDLETPADAAEPPKSPSWIPSYSVESQGPSPLPSPKAEGTEELPLEAVNSAPAVESSPNAVTEIEVEESAPVPEAPPEIVVEEAAAEEAEDPHREESVGIALDAGVEIAAAAVVAEAATEAFTTESSTDTAEPPKSGTWIPSYSVSSQGPSPLPSPKLDATEVPELEAEPVPALELTETVEAVEELPATGNAETEGNISEFVTITEDVQAPTEAEDVNVPTDSSAALAGNDETIQPPIISMTEVEAEAAVGGAPTERRSTWIPSYSVNSQGASPLHVPHATEDVDVEKLEPLSSFAAGDANGFAIEPPTVVENVAETVTDALGEVPTIATTEDPESSSDAVTEPASAVSLTAESEIERPKSPWIPSYSISQQGASPLHTPVSGEDKELGQLEQLPAPITITENHVAVSAPEEMIDDVGAPSIITAVEDIVQEGAVESSDVQPSIVVESVETETSAIAEERPERPWTPSYTVTRQGPGTPSEEAADEEAEESASTATQETVSNGHSPQVFPSTEDAATGLKKVATKPSLTRLAPVNEDEQIDISVEASSPAPETATPTGARARLESTTSSRFFPGGWFSSAPKEGGTSVEIAEGEFSKSPAASPALEVPANTPVDGADERKRRWWCVIM